MTTTSAPPREINRTVITIAVMLGTFLAALEATIVGTAMPTIIGTLGGIALYSWVFSAYLLTSTATVPIYGKLADLYGRKPMFLSGASIFIVGSVLCGFAQSMEQLVAFRTLQGLGAGAIIPITSTIVGDIYPVEQRAKVQGLFSSVWGISALVGPAIGALIVQHFDWRWVFFVNLPFGIVAGGLLWIFLHERFERRNHAIDYLGSLTLTTGIVALLLVLLQTSAVYGWGSPITVGLLAVSLGAFVAFLWQENRAPEPMLPLSLFRNRIIAVANTAGFLSGVVMFGMSTYVPLFVQGALGGTAADAGAVVAPMSIGWPLASIVGGRLILRVGFRKIALLGMGMIVVSAVLLQGLTVGSSQWLIRTLMLVVGFGLGFSTLSFLLSVQSSVHWAQRGIATASIMFFRSIGGTIGVGIMGAVFNSQMDAQLAPLSQRYPDLFASGASATNVLLDAAARSRIPADVVQAMQVALGTSLQPIYGIVLVVALVGVGATWFLPARRMEDYATAERTARGIEGRR